MLFRNKERQWLNFVQFDHFLFFWVEILHLKQSLGFGRNTVWCSVKIQTERVALKDIHLNTMFLGQTLRLFFCGGWGSDSWICNTSCNKRLMNINMLKFYRSSEILRKCTESIFLVFKLESLYSHLVRETFLGSNLFVILINKVENKLFIKIIKRGVK